MCSCLNKSQELGERKRADWPLLVHTLPQNVLCEPRMMEGWVPERKLSAGDRRGGMGGELVKTLAVHSPT